jgi:hypothetical protein
MPVNRNFDEFIKEGFVSVWVGDFRSEDDFDDYLLDHFATEFSFELRPQAVREMGVESEPVEIGKLVQGFSRSKTFDLKVVEAARTHGITTASCMFIIYNFKYDSGCQAMPNPGVKFIGAVPFPGFE